MKPIKFKECNTIFAKNQKEYLPLLVYKEKTTKEGQVISCWSLSIIERIRLLLTGKIYLMVLTFNKPLQPQLITCNKWDILNKEYFKNNPIKNMEDDMDYPPENDH